MLTFFFLFFFGSNPTLSFHMKTEKNTYIYVHSSSTSGKNCSLLIQTLQDLSLSGTLADPYLVKCVFPAASPCETATLYYVLISIILTNDFYYVIGLMLKLFFSTFLSQLWHYFPTVPTTCSPNLSISTIFWGQLNGISVMHFNLSHRSH